MQAEELQKHIDTFKGRKLPDILRQVAYSKGRNVAILQPAAKSDPDNRIISPHALRAVNFLKGYCVSPGNVRYSGPTYDKLLKPIFDQNNEPLITANEFESGATHGGMFELHWVEAGKFCFEVLPFAQSIPIFNTDLRPRLIAFIWWRLVDDVETATVYDATQLETWTLGKNGWEVTTPARRHGYAEVPVNARPFQAGWRNLFDHALSLMDLHDKIMSQDVANEAERFNAALLVMRKRLSSAVDEDGLTEVQKAKLWKIIDGSDDPHNEAAFVTRDIPTGFIELALQTVRKDIIQSLQLIDPYDESFANASGAAQDRKLLPMLYLFNSIKPYFLQFLQARIKLICGHVLNKTPGDDVEIVIHTEMPANKLEMVQTAVQLATLASKETALRSLPPSLVPDVKAELKLLEEEKPSDGFDLVDTQTQSLPKAKPTTKPAPAQSVAAK